MRPDQPLANPPLQWFCPHRMHCPLSECEAVMPFFLNHINISSRTVSGEAGGSVGELLAVKQRGSSVSRTDTESWAWRPLLIIPGPGRQEGRPQSAWASQASLIDELQPMRDPVLEEVGCITDEP